MKKNKKLILISLLTSIGVVLSIIEGMIPLPILIPGAKIGLSNIVQVTAIAMIGPLESIYIAALKSIIVGIGTGNLMGVFYSLPASLVSTIVMIMAYKLLSKKLSLIGVSILGAVTHNFVQILVASLIMNNSNIFIYYPYLSIIAIFTGLFIGTTTMYFEKRLNRIYTTFKN